MRELRAGVYRATARDGTVAALIVGEGGAILELMKVGMAEPPARPSVRRIANSMRELHARAEARRQAELLDALEALPRGWRDL